MTTIRIIRPADGREVAAVMDLEAAAAVSRLQGRVWLLAADSKSEARRWFFDGEPEPSFNKNQVPLRSAVLLGGA